MTATIVDYRRVQKRFHYVLDALSGTGEDWLEAIESLGVRPIYYNGAHSAYLGKDKPNWTNATVAYFSTREDAQEWCERVNGDFEIESFDKNSIEKTRG